MRKEDAMAMSKYRFAPPGGLPGSIQGLASGFIQGFCVTVEMRARRFTPN